MATRRIDDMEGENFIPWVPADFPITSRVSFEGIVYGSGGLKIDLREDEGEKRPLSLIFSELPTAVRIANESLRLVSLPLLPKDVQHSIFLVNNSQFLRWLNTESLNIYASDPIFHLAIVTDEWIDLICNDQPIVVIRKDEK
jgi:hypothetical protein